MFVPMPTSMQVTQGTESESALMVSAILVWTTASVTLSYSSKMKRRFVETLERTVWISELDTSSPLGSSMVTPSLCSVGLKPTPVEVFWNLTLRMARPQSWSKVSVRLQVTLAMMTFSSSVPMMLEKEVLPTPRSP